MATSSSGSREGLGYQGVRSRFALAGLTSLPLPARRRSTHSWAGVRSRRAATYHFSESPGQLSEKRGETRAYAAGAPRVPSSGGESVRGDTPVWRKATTSTSVAFPGFGGSRDG